MILQCFRFLVKSKFLSQALPTEEGTPSSSHSSSYSSNLTKTVTFSDELANSEPNIPTLPGAGQKRETDSSIPSSITTADTTIPITTIKDDSTAVPESCAKSITANVVGVGVSVGAAAMDEECAS